MKVTGFDTETTGLDPLKGHKIVEIALLTYDFETRKLVDSYVRRFDPERAIDADAQRVHGISYLDLVECPKFAELADEISEKLSGTDLLIAHNLGFDAPFIATELSNAGKEVPDVRGLCTMTEARWATPDGKYPKLKELCFALGVEYDDAKAHAADYDVMVMMDCFFKGFDRGFYSLPDTFPKIDKYKNCYGDS